MKVRRTIQLQLLLFISPFNRKARALRIALQKFPICGACSVVVWGHFWSLCNLQEVEFDRNPSLFQILILAAWSHFLDRSRLRWGYKPNPFVFCSLSRLCCLSFTLTRSQGRSHVLHLVSYLLCCGLNLTFFLSRTKDSPLYMTTGRHCTLGCGITRDHICIDVQLGIRSHGQLCLSGFI